MKSPINLQAYKQRLGHDIDGVRPVMIPADDGVWFSRSEVELAFHYNDMMRLPNKLEAAERERDEMKGSLKAAAVNAETWMKRALKAEMEIARRDAAAGEPVAWEITTKPGEFSLTPDKSTAIRAITNGCCVRELHATVPPAVLPQGGVAKALHDCDWSGVSIGNKAIIQAAIEALGAQSAVLPPAVGEVRLGEYRDDGTRPAEVICLHEQADWENFTDGTKLYLGAQPQKPVVPDYFSSLVNRATDAAKKAMVKFPQPNYVLLKVAEEAGEVVQAGVHYAEGRETWDNLEGEVVQTIAMLYRLVTEGDQVNGITPPKIDAADVPYEEKK